MEFKQDPVCRGCGCCFVCFWTISDRPRGWVHHLWELMCFWVRGLCGGWQLAPEATFNKDVLLKWDLLAGCDVSWMHPIDLVVLVIFVPVVTWNCRMRARRVTRRFPLIRRDCWEAAGRDGRWQLICEMPSNKTHAEWQRQPSSSH